MDWGVAKALDGSSERPRDGDVQFEMGAERAHALTSDGTVLGTHGFMAPEQARGDHRDVDERADVYGLGAILRALLGGDAVPPHDQAVTPAASAPSSIPRPLRSICAHALATAPRDRYATAAELGEDIARFRAGQAVRAHRETAIEKAARITKLYRLPILLVLSYMIMRALVALATGW